MRFQNAYIDVRAEKSQTDATVGSYIKVGPFFVRAIASLSCAIVFGFRFAVGSVDKFPGLTTTYLQADFGLANLQIGFVQ